MRQKGQNTTKLQVNKRTGHVYFWKKITQKEYTALKRREIKNIQKQLKLLITKT